MTKESEEPSHEQYLGKRALIGVNYIAVNGELLGRRQYHGVVQESKRPGWLTLVQSGDEEDFDFPGPLEPAKPGEYVLAGTQEVVVDPDYIAVYTVQETPPPEP